MMDEESYERDRFQDQRNYYDKKATRYQRKWLAFSIIIVLLSPVPLVVLSFVELPMVAKLIILGTSYAATVLGSLLSLLKYRELWISYRTTEQEMLKEYYQYKTCTGAYSGIQNKEERFRLFVERIEGIMAQERSKWLDYIQQQYLPGADHPKSS